MSRFLTRLFMSANYQKFLKHGYVAFEGSEVVLTPKGTRVLLGILFKENEAEMLQVITDFEAEQKKSSDEG